jgi:hypothetical protein
MPFTCGYCAARGERKAFPHRAALARHIGHSRLCRRARAAQQEALPETSSEEDGEAEDEAEPVRVHTPEPPASPPPEGRPESPQPAHAPGSRNVQIEEVPDEDDAGPRGRASGWERYVETADEEYLKSAGAPLRAESTVFEHIREAQEDKGETRYGALSSDEISEVAAFVVECVGKSDADRFFKLARVRNCILWSFVSCLSPPSIM